MPCIKTPLEEISMEILVSYPDLSYDLFRESFDIQARFHNTFVIHPLQLQKETITVLTQRYYNDFISLI